MNITELLQSKNGERHFSFEVLPPLKGNGTGTLFQTIDKLKEFQPLFINITNHSSQYVYRELENGLIERHRVRRRPGSVAIAAAIQNRYHIPVMPHVICGGATADDIEYELLDMQFLGISNVLVLRGDKADEDKRFTPVKGGWAHTTDLIRQVNRFNEGYFADGTPIRHPGEPFHYGVACYPEKHEEAANMQTDMEYFKQKVDLGAGYAVTQMFFDNSKYFAFVEASRKAGITVPIIPGIKPFTKLSQLTTVPKTFHCDLPEELVVEARKCRSDADAKELGVEWGVAQCKELMAHGVPSIHFYSMGAAESIRRIAEQIY